MLSSCDNRKELSEKEYFKQKYLLLKKYNYDKLEGWTFIGGYTHFSRPEGWFKVRNILIDSLGGIGIKKKKGLVNVHIFSEKESDNLCKFYKIPKDSINDYLLKKFKFIFDLDIKHLEHKKNIIVFQIDYITNYIFYLYDIKELSKYEDLYGKMTHIEGNWYYQKRKGINKFYK